MEIIHRRRSKEFVAQDEAVVRELVSPRNSSLKNQSIAEVTIPIGRTIREHYHKKIEEVYSIMSGMGEMSIDGETEIVGKGDSIVILPEQRHKMTCIGDEDLVMFVTCSPSHTDDDQIIIDDTA
jgi:mannose-6-phosphate isomerase-like protein (cupin superfamily)